MNKSLMVLILLSFLVSACQIGSNPPNASPTLELESSPTWTEAPTSTATPATSDPGEKGRGGFIWYMFWMINVSAKFTPAACTSILTPSLSTFGGATSSTTRDSGGPKALHKTAFISSPYPPAGLCSARIRPSSGSSPGILTWVRCIPPCKRFFSLYISSRVS